MYRRRDWVIVKCCGISEIGRILHKSIRQRHFLFAFHCGIAFLPKHKESLWILSVCATPSPPAVITWTSSQASSFGCRSSSSFSSWAESSKNSILSDSWFWCAGNALLENQWMSAIPLRLSSDSSRLWGICPRRYRLNTSCRYPVQIQEWYERVDAFCPADILR